MDRTANAVCPDTDPQLGLSASSSLQKENDEPLPGLPVSADGSNVRNSCTLNPRYCSASSVAVFAPELDASPSLALPASGIYSAFSSHCFLICPDFTSPPTPGQMVAHSEFPESLRGFFPPTTKPVQSTLSPCLPCLSFLSAF